MTVELSGLRPAVIGMNTRQHLDNYRGLRHVIRNVYAFNLRPARLAELVDNSAERGLAGFCRFFGKDLLTF
jgi:hypothetical protein